MSMTRHRSHGNGSTYTPSILSERWTPGTPWGRPARPTILPAGTRSPARTSIDDR
jgi:hypothetical protein